MASVFSKIIAGELPGRFVHQDDLAVAFLTIAPIRPGHTLVVPRQEIDQWTDASPQLWQHLTGVAQRIGQAVKTAWEAPRSVVMVAGFEVAHLHLHVVPAWDMSDLDFGKADTAPDPSAMDDAADRIRAALG
jgi:histidine triad (HIT) family protein